MAIISQVRSRGELLLNFATLPPISECSFFLLVDTPIELANALKIFDFKNDFIVTAFNIPQFGITYTQTSDVLGYVSPQLAMQSFDVSFLCKAGLGKPKSLIHSLYHSQFNDSGTLKFLPKDKLPKVYLCVNTAGFETRLVEFSGCRFSNPIPTVNLQGTGQAVFRTTVAYMSFTDYTTDYK